MEPEIGAQWEVGQRFRVPGSRVFVNAAAFDIVRRNVALSLPGGFFDQAGYSLLNLCASLRCGRARYSVSFSNLADTEYWASQRGSRLYYPGEGRRILATVRIGN